MADFLVRKLIKYTFVETPALEFIPDSSAVRRANG